MQTYKIKSTSASGIKRSFAHFDYQGVDAYIKGGVVGNPEQHRENYRDPMFDTDWIGVSGGRNGWNSYVREGSLKEQKRIRELASQFEMKAPKGIRTKRRSTRGRQGDELDIHSVRSGNLDRAWRRTRKIEKKGKAKRITIIYSTEIYCSEKPVVAFYSPAAAAVISQKLSEAKVAVEIIAAAWQANAFRPSGNGVTTLLASCRVKTMNAPLALAPLAATSTAGWTRSGRFAICTASDLPVTGGMGRRDELFTNEIYHEVFGRPEGEVIIVPKFQNEQEAKSWITATINELS